MAALAVATLTCALLAALVFDTITENTLKNCEGVPPESFSESPRASFIAYAQIGLTLILAISLIWGPVSLRAIASAFCATQVGLSVVLLGAYNNPKSNLLLYATASTPPLAVALAILAAKLSRDSRAATTGVLLLAAATTAAATAQIAGAAERNTALACAVIAWTLVGGAAVCVTRYRVAPTATYLIILAALLGAACHVPEALAAHEIIGLLAGDCQLVGTLAVIYMRFFATNTKKPDSKQK